jgi:TetR/AcrR family transcriptional regulator, cholesterol catabolism regulator
MASPAKEKQIIRAAEELFNSRRFHEVTMEDVCLAARVGKGTIYRYFKDKEELFLKVATSGSEELCDLVRRKSVEPLPFEERILGILMEIHHARRRHGIVRLLMRSDDARVGRLKGALHSHFHERRSAVIGAVTQVLQEAVREGKLRRDVPPELLAGSLLGMFHGYTWETERPFARETGQQLLDLFLRGAGAASAPVREVNP